NRRRERAADRFHFAIGFGKTSGRPWTPGRSSAALRGIPESPWRFDRGLLPARGHPGRQRRRKRRRSMLSQGVVPRSAAWGGAVAVVPFGRTPRRRRRRQLVAKTGPTFLSTIAALSLSMDQETSSNTSSLRACWSQVGIWGNRSCPELQQHVHCRNCPAYAEAAVLMVVGPVAPRCA